MVAEETLILESISDERSLGFLNWHQWLRPSMATLVVICGIFGTAGKCLTINYVLKYAPRARPLNLLIFLDKVPIL